MIVKQNQRNVLSFRVARELIRRGFPVEDFATSHKYDGKIVVKFAATPEFDDAFEDIMQEVSGKGDDRI